MFILIYTDPLTKDQEIGCFQDDQWVYFLCGQLGLAKRVLMYEEHLVELAKEFAELEYKVNHKVFVWKMLF